MGIEEVLTNGLSGDGLTPGGDGLDPGSIESPILDTMLADLEVILAKLTIPGHEGEPVAVLPAPTDPTLQAVYFFSDMAGIPVKAAPLPGQTNGGFLVAPVTMRTVTVTSYPPTSLQLKQGVKYAVTVGNYAPVVILVSTDAVMNFISYLNPGTLASILGVCEV